MEIQSFRLDVPDRLAFVLVSNLAEHQAPFAHAANAAKVANVCLNGDGLRLRFLICRGLLINSPAKSPFHGSCKERLSLREKACLIRNSELPARSNTVGLFIRHGCPASIPAPAMGLLPSSQQLLDYTSCNLAYP